MTRGTQTQTQTHTQTHTQTPTATCELVVLATYDRNPVSECHLDHWLASGPNETARHVERVNDCLGVVCRVPLAADDVANAVTRDAVRKLCELPDNQLLGATRLLLVQVDQDADGRDVLAHLLGEDADRLTGGSWPGQGELLVGLDPDLLICVYPTGDDVDQLLAGQQGCAVRLLETLRHKMQGQFAEYTGEFRGRLLDAERSLQQRLAALGTLTCGDGGGDDRATERILAASREVTSAYCQAALLHGPVRKIRAMLAANLTNLREAAERFLPADGERCPAARLLRQRVATQQMLLAQVDADLGLVEPVFEAARCVGQFHHGQLLAQLATTEACENRQRDRQSRDRERHNLRLMGLGLWLGLSQLWFAWIAMWPVAARPEGLALLGWCLVPTCVGIVGVAAALVVQRWSSIFRPLGSRQCVL